MFEGIEVDEALIDRVGVSRWLKVGVLEVGKHLVLGMWETEIEESKSGKGRRGYKYPWY